MLRFQRQVRTSLRWQVLAIGLVLSGCYQDRVDKKIIGEPIAGVGVPIWLSERMQQCNTRGYSWLAMDAQGEPGGRCGERLVSFSCNKQTIVARFGKKHKNLEYRLAKLHQLRLYNCGQTDAGQVILHFYGRFQTKIRYQTMTLQP